MSRQIPPLPASSVVEFQNNSMNPSWRNFWQNLLLWATEVNSGYPNGATLQASTSYANDAAAAAGGVPIGGYYRNGSVVQIRIV